MTNNSETIKFSHLNTKGEANMVDVSAKAESAREAAAQARIILKPEVLDRVIAQDLAKGDVFAVARIAGIQAAKKCADLIPLCHPLPLSKVNVSIEVAGDTTLEIQTLCKTTGKTGVEMEALTAAAVAALTIYDMAKALDKGIVIEQVRLLKKSGGKSGEWVLSDD